MEENKSPNSFKNNLLPHKDRKKNSRTETYQFFCEKLVNSKVDGKFVVKLSKFVVIFPFLKFHFLSKNNSYSNSYHRLEYVLDLCLI